MPDTPAGPGAPEPESPASDHPSPPDDVDRPDDAAVAGAPQPEPGGLGEAPAGPGQAR